MYSRNPYSECKKITGPKEPKYQKCTSGKHIGGSVIPAAVKTPDNKFARIIKPGRNMPAVKTPDKKFA